MKQAKFAVGQIVAFERGNGDSHVPAGEFTILRVMPAEDSGRSYRVRGQQDGHERVLPETQMRLFSGRDSEAKPQAPSAPGSLLGMI
jgi:hypothetical protein